MMILFLCKMPIKGEEQQVELFSCSPIAFSLSLRLNGKDNTYNCSRNVEFFDSKRLSPIRFVHQIGAETK